MLQLVKESTLNGLYDRIYELERQLQDANVHNSTLEKDYLKKLKEKTDEMAICKQEINDKSKEIKDLKNQLATEQTNNESLKKDIEAVTALSKSEKQRFEETSKQLDRQKRYQKEFSTQKTKEVSELKEQLESKQKELDAANDDLQKKKAEVAMMSALYEAGVTELCKFMRTTPAFKTKKKEVVMELADEMICKRAKETLDAHVKPKENQTEDNKEESKENE